MIFRNSVSLLLHLFFLLFFFFTCFFFVSKDIVISLITLLNSYFRDKIMEIV